MRRPRSFRRFLHDFAGHLSAFPASSFWIGEYGEDEIAVAPEFAVADAIISLATTRAAERETRSLRVLKLRGSEFAPGQHAYRVSANGIDVFPRLADAIDITDYPLEGARHSSGIAALDEMLADGYWPGASTLCAGPSGSRQDADGPALHLQRRPSGRTGRARDTSGDTRRNSAGSSRDSGGRWRRRASS